ncbi:hypothetical protein CN065_31665 [Sinorhizobium meliloti]|nr:hypothetical protein CDO24_12405 [Sinorhizobium meliloti]RVQ27472.1 hypothetical protein CN065_31665 [Sinorhizobium meliloti]
MQPPLIPLPRPSPRRRGEGDSRHHLRHHDHDRLRTIGHVLSPCAAGESHLANKRLFCCGKSILGVLR